MLRQCQNCGRKRGVVYAYLLCDMAPQAVQAALSVDLALAKQVAQGAGEGQRKALWLAIARHVIAADADARRALLLLKESDGALRIEDLLPLLPDFTEIELFKEDICGTLEDCGSRIDHLKSEMEELSESAESINTELESMKRRGYSVSSLQRCEYCPTALFNRQFYLFPCSHGFHNDCLMQRVHEHKHLDPPQLEAVSALETQIAALARRSKDDKRAMSQQEYLQNELDGYVAADCPLCGYVMIRSLASPLVSESDLVDAQSWEL
jgi:ribosomal protein S14